MRTVLVIDDNPAVASALDLLFGLHDIHVLRATSPEQGMATLTRNCVDLVIADTFAGARTPAHLTSAEFTAAVARVLSPSGSYAANVGDGPPLAHARARVATVCSVFPHACLIADAAVLRGRRFGNLVLAAARHDLPLTGLARRVASDPFPGRLVHSRDLDRFAAGAKPITDARAEPSLAPPPGIFQTG